MYGIFSRGSGFFVWSQRVSEFFVSVTTLCDEWSKFRNRLFLKERFFNLYFKITAFVLNFKKKKHPKIWRPELHKSLTMQHLSHPIFSYSYMRSMESLKKKLRKFSNSHTADWFFLKHPKRVCDYDKSSVGNPDHMWLFPSNNQWN